MGPTAPVAEFLYEAADLVSPGAALASVVIVSVVSFTLCIWVLTFPSALRRAGRKRAAAATSSVPPEPGPILLKGRVDYEASADFAVRLEVTQTGTEEESSGNWTQVWRETDRRITVCPFVLETDSGQRLRVEPTRNVTFIDEFTKKVLINRTTRVRTAELEQGEYIWIQGELFSVKDTTKPEGYRSTGTVLVLKDSAAHPMRISSQPLDAAHERKARQWLIAGVVLLLGALIIQGSFVPFYLRSWLGQTDEGVVVGRSVVDGGEGSDEYLVQVRLPNATVVSVEVAREHHNVFIQDMPMSVRRVRGITWFAQAGPEPSLDWFHLGVTLVLAFGAVIGVSVARTGKWEEPGNKLVEKESGRLPR